MYKQKEKTKILRNTQQTNGVMYKQKEKKKKVMKHTTNKWKEGQTKFDIYNGW